MIMASVWLTFPCLYLLVSHSLAMKIMNLGATPKVKAWKCYVWLILVNYEPYIISYALHFR